MSEQPIKRHTQNQTINKEISKKCFINSEDVIKFEKDFLNLNYKFLLHDFGFVIENSLENITIVISKCSLFFQGHGTICNISGLTINHCNIPNNVWLNIFSPSTHAHPVLDCCSSKINKSNVEKSLKNFVVTNNCCQLQSLLIKLMKILDDNQYFLFSIKSSCHEISHTLKKIASFSNYNNLFPNSIENEKSWKISLLNSIDLENANCQPNNILSSQFYFNLSTEMINATNKIKEMTKLTKEKNIRILVCGVKDSGKSSLIRHILNTLLLSNTNNELSSSSTTNSNQLSVAVLDVDVGQPEFTPSGLVSLTLVHSPLFGPPFTHCVAGVGLSNKLTTQILSQCFVGALSPADCAHHYVNCMEYVFQAYLNLPEPRPPLLVNTMGWMEGLGLRFLANTLSLTCPNVLIQINVKHQKRNAPSFTMDFISSLNLIKPHTRTWESSPYELIEVNSCASTTGRSSLGSAEHRNITLLSYFLHNLRDLPSSVPIARSMTSSQNIGNNSFYAQQHSSETIVKWLLGLQPRHCRWSDLNSVVLKVMFWRHDVPESVLSVLQVCNASLVALCSLPNLPQSTNIKWLPVADSHLDTEPRGGSGRSSGYNSSRQAVPTLVENQVCECLGLGIVRSIDFTNRYLLVLTHLSDVELANVNCIMKGIPSLPPCLLTEQPQQVPTFYVEKQQNIGVGRKALPQTRKFLNVRRHQH